jgi:1,2-diacylglycerol 3-beta-galactosyltransferase
MHVQGFTTDVPMYMRLADFFIGKPGPGSISEALAMRLPVIVERNQWTLAHERYNADWIVEQQVGMVVSNFSRLGEAIAELLSPTSYERYRTNAAALKNSAVYEIPELLAQVLDGATVPPSHVAHGGIDPGGFYRRYQTGPYGGQDQHSGSDA